MRIVADGVLELSLGFVHVHLIVMDNGAVLVDTGLPRHGARIEQALAAAERSVGAIRTILLTHRHWDHVGGVAHLQRRSRARVIAHSVDAPMIEGVARNIPPWPMKLTVPFVGKLEPVRVDEAVTADGPISVPGITAVHTPGHTAGHLSFLLDRDGGILFAGDAAGGGRGGRVHNSPRILTQDHAAAADSVRKLAGLQFDVAVFGHGPAVVGRAVDRFKECAAA